MSGHSPQTTKNGWPLASIDWLRLEAEAIKYYGVTWARHFAFFPIRTMDGWVWLRWYWYLPIVGAMSALKKDKPYVQAN